MPDRFTFEYLKECVVDSGKILVSPVNWDSTDWLKAGLVFGATTGIYFADSEIRKTTQKNRSPFLDNTSKIGEVLGNPVYSVPSLGIYYLYANANYDSKARRTSLLALESVAISGALTMTLKLATQRPRPFTGEASTVWDGPGIRNLNSAFPSAHTQTAFSLASVIVEEYSNIRYLAPIAYGLASFVGISRVYDDKHWGSDVFLGAALGYFVGKSVVKYHSNQGDAALTFIPSVRQNGFELSVKYRF
jgi:membrane-associated phospholipid phosphatase